MELPPSLQTHTHILTSTTDDLEFPDSDVNLPKVLRIYLRIFLKSEVITLEIWLGSTEVKRLEWIQDPQIWI